MYDLWQQLNPHIKVHIVVIAMMAGCVLAIVRGYLSGRSVEAQRHHRTEAGGS